MAKRTNRAEAVPGNQLERKRRSQPSPLADTAREILGEAASMLPFGLRGRLNLSWDGSETATDLSAYPSKLAGLVQLVVDPQRTVDRLKTKPWRANALAE